MIARAFPARPRFLSKAPPHPLPSPESLQAPQVHPPATAISYRRCPFPAVSDTMNALPHTQKTPPHNLHNLFVSGKSHTKSGCDAAGDPPIRQYLFFTAPCIRPVPESQTRASPPVPSRCRTGIRPGTGRRPLSCRAPEHRQAFRSLVLLHSTSTLPGLSFACRP